MRTLKKPPKGKTFLLENGKKYRRNADFQTNITFEKKLPFLLQCKKVTLQEQCVSDVIWTGDHLNTSCGLRTVWGWFGLYPLCHKIDEKQLDFSDCFFFIAWINKNSADSYAPNKDGNAQKSYQILSYAIQNIAIGIRTAKHIRYSVDFLYISQLKDCEWVFKMPVIYVAKKSTHPRTKNHVRFRTDGWKTA